MRDFTNYMQSFAHPEFMLGNVTEVSPLFLVTLKGIYFGNEYAVEGRLTCGLWESLGTGTPQGPIRSPQQYFPQV
jgi:hypothetical protein